MIGWLARVTRDDSFLDLRADDVVRIEPGAPRPARVVHPSDRDVVPNFGYMAYLHEIGGLELLGPRAVLRRRLRAAASRPERLLQHPHPPADRERPTGLQVVG